jgi:hypothetical protein
MGTRLTYWTELIQYFVDLGYPWYVVLKYIIAYYQKYQNRTDEPAAWFEPDSTLLHYHIALVRQKSAPPLAPPQSASGSAAPSSNRPPQTSLRARPTGQRLETMSSEICLMFNQSGDCRWRDKDGGSCPRKHICSSCTTPDHIATSCSAPAGKARSQK